MYSNLLLYLLFLKKKATLNLIKNLPFEWLIGIQYIYVKKRNNRNNFISFISFISISGIALGIAALIVVLSVMNGFQKEVRERMLSMFSHIEILNVSNAMWNWQTISKKVIKNKSVIAVAPYVSEQALMTRTHIKEKNININNNSIVHGVLVRGILPNEELKVSNITTQIKQGNFAHLRSGEFNIILGTELANSLCVNLGEKITLITSHGKLTPIGVLPHLQQFTVVGIFEAGHYEFDMGLVFIQIEDAKKIFSLDSPSGLRVRIKDALEAPNVTSLLTKTLTGNLYLRDWSQQNSNWFAALKTEKRIMFLILFLIITIAAFNLVSTLVMTVVDKKTDIAILRTLGASSHSIMKIFVIQGILIGTIGIIIGTSIGVLIAWNIDIIVSYIEQFFHVQFLPKSIYIISKLPSDLIWSDVCIINIITIFLAFLATLYPSLIAARIKPAEVLRYE